jgi:outer membrane receptor protein involved in Fe transport
VISKFNLTGYVAKDLTGKYIMETAPNQVNASVVWRMKLAHFAVYYHFIDAQWTDDENTIASKAHHLIDLKIYKELRDHFNVNLGIQNFLNNQYLDEKGQVNIGRFIMAGLGVRF